MATCMIILASKTSSGVIPESFFRSCPSRYASPVNTCARPSLVPLTAPASPLASIPRTFKSIGSKLLVCLIRPAQLEIPQASLSTMVGPSPQLKASPMVICMTW